MVTKNNLKADIVPQPIGHGLGVCVYAFLYMVGECQGICDGEFHRIGSSFCLFYK